MTITSLTLHFFEPGPLALLFPRQKKKNPQPVAIVDHSARSWRRRMASELGKALVDGRI
jgi:hypothetical protein